VENDLEDKKGNPRIDLVGPGIFFSGPFLNFYRGRRDIMKNFVVFLASWLIIFFAAPVGASDQKKELPALDTVVVTATRTEIEKQVVPANVSIIESKQIEQSGARSVVELLRSQEGLAVRDLLGNGKSAAVDLRGFGESGPYNTLVLVDGRRVNEMDLSGVDWTQVPVDQIERIEIVRGTGTVLYGDNAVGGVINIITKNPREGLSAKAKVLSGSYSRHKEKLFISAGKNGLAGLLSVGYDSGEGYRENGELRAKDIGGRVNYDISEFLSLSLKGGHHKDTYGLPGPLNEKDMANNRRASRSPDDGAETSDGYLALTTEMDFGKFGGITTDVSFRDRSTDEKFASYSFAAERDSRTWSLTPRYVLNSKPFGHKNNFISGLDFYRSKLEMDSFFGTSGFKSSEAEAERTSLGIYAHNEFYIKKDIVLSAGARREWVKYDLQQNDLTGFLSPLSDSVEDAENAYTLGLSYLYRDDCSVFLRVNRSFRFQLSDELILYDFSAGKIKANKDLKPQRGQHIELGLAHRLNKSLEGRVTLFRASIKDEIFYNSSTYTNENHPETLHQGIELGARARLFTFLSLFGNYTFEEATFEEAPFRGNYVPAVPKHRANAGFEIRDLLQGLTFTGSYNYVGKSYAISDQANKLSKAPSYNTINATLSYEWKFITAHLGVNNVTNEKYSDYVVAGGFPLGLNYYPAPERNWVAGLEIKY